MILLSKHVQLLYKSVPAHRIISAQICVLLTLVWALMNSHAALALEATCSGAMNVFNGFPNNWQCWSKTGIILVDIVFPPSHSTYTCQSNRSVSASVLNWILTFHFAFVTTDLQMSVSPSLISCALNQYSGSSFTAAACPSERTTFQISLSSSLTHFACLHRHTHMTGDTSAQTHYSKLHISITVPSHAIPQNHCMQPHADWRSGVLLECQWRYKLK